METCAVHMERGPCPCLTPPPPPCAPQCLPCSGGAGLLLLPSPSTPPELRESASVRGRSSPWPPMSCAMCCLSLGCHFSQWLRRKRGGVFSALQRRMALTSQSLGVSAVYFLFWDQRKHSSTSPCSHGRPPAPAFSEQGGTFPSSCPNFVYMGGRCSEGDGGVGGRVRNWAPGTKVGTSYSSLSSLSWH